MVARRAINTLQQQLGKQEKTAYGMRKEKYQPTPTKTHLPSPNTTTHHQPLPTTCSLARTLAGATYSPRVRWRDTRAARSIPRDWLSQQSKTQAISFCGSLTSTLDHRRLKCMKDAGCDKLRVRQRLMHREWHFRWLALVLNKPTLAWPKSR